MVTVEKRPAPYLVFRGGNPLRGEIEVAGSKNISLALLSAVVLCEEPVTLTNVPQISDTRHKASLLESFGAKIDWVGDRMTIDSRDLHLGQVDEEVTRAIRTSFYLLGPLLARLGSVDLPMPGGCKIGERPVDFHLKGLRAMGADILEEGGVYRSRVNGFNGSEIYLDVPSAGATQHLMTTAARAKGITTIRNAAMEPEVTTLADFLIAMGASIEGAGTPTITITGRERLNGGTFRVPADRLQAGTFLLAAAITHGDVKVCGILPEHQLALGTKLKEAGAEVTEGNDWVRVAAPDRLHGVQIQTAPHPGFPTDIQQPFCAALTLASGISTIKETIYESRTGHITELNRMGAQIRNDGRTATIQGVEKLTGAIVEASDLRAGAALCLAGLAAEGETTVRNIHWIDRGYESIEATFRRLGGDAERHDA